jgi:hypothetical protein
VRNPNDPWRREWGTGSVIATIVAIVIMAGIIAYGTITGTKMSTGPNSTALHHNTTPHANINARDIVITAQVARS